MYNGKSCCGTYTMKLAGVMKQDVVIHVAKVFANGITMHTSQLLFCLGFKTQKTREYKV